MTALVTGSAGGIGSAIVAKLRAEGLLRVVGEWESEHGSLMDAELRTAERLQRMRRRR